MKVNVELLKAKSDMTCDIMTNPVNYHHVASDTNYFRIIKTNKYHYGDREEITPHHLMTSVLNKYDVLLTLGKWSSMSPEQEQITALTTVVENSRAMTSDFQGPSIPILISIKEREINLSKSK